MLQQKPPAVPPKKSSETEAKNFAPIWGEFKILFLNKANISITMKHHCAIDIVV